MAIHIQEESQLQKGHKKSIDESGIMMIFDTLQKYQYAFPIKSTVRELLCNGIDSVAEKKVAKQILKGEANVSDFFVEIEGDLYKDSKFTPDYYDLKWLSDDDRVHMTYYVKGALEKDMVVFADNGVGLGGKRLEGYFKLAYSTKRLSKLPLGKFGLGAKSPLSVGVDFYTVESRYNGQLYRFNVYSSKVDSIIPKMNMETGKENEHILFNEGTEDEYPVYYLPTTAKNGVTVTVEAKKHHKQQYLDAVRSQMLYFDGIDLQVISPVGVENIPYKADILYEDDLIVMSDNQYYSKPHLLLNKVNYGYIAWEELELEDKNGNIGIKVAPEDVEVNPSRESVLWTEKTKNKVLNRFNEVVDIAAGMIQQELQSTDFMQWLKTCYSIYNKYSDRGGIVGRLSKIVDLTRAKFKFMPDERIIFDAAYPLPGITSRLVEVIEEKDASKVKKKKVIRKEFDSYGNKWNMPIFLMRKDERANNRRDKYLFKRYPSGFIQILEPWGSLDEAEKAGATEDQIKRMYKGNTKDRFAYWEALKISEGATWYSDVEVPEDFNANDEEVEEEVITEETATVEEVKQSQVAHQTAAERRKQQGKTLIYVLEKVAGNRNTIIGKDENGQPVAGLKAFDWRKLEIPIAEINNWDAPEIYYGFEADSELMHFIGLLTQDPHPGNAVGKCTRAHAFNINSWTEKKWWRVNGKRVGEVYNLGASVAYGLQHFFDTKIMLVKGSKNNAKYLRDFSRIEEFFISIENRTITMSNVLIKWNTARLIRERLASCAFLYNFPFRADMQELYEEVCKYIDRNYRNVDTTSKTYGLSQETYDDMIKHLDRVHEFQKFVAQAPNDYEGIGALANQFFGNKDLRNGMAVDPEMMRKVDELCDYAHVCGNMLNYLPVLTGYPANTPVHPYTYGETRAKPDKIPDDLEQEIRMYLSDRGALDYAMPVEAKLPVEGEVFAETA